MNKLIALCWFVLSLYGCDIGGSTFVHRSQANGTDTLHSKVVAQPGIARFECVRSVSGQCYYTLFPPECASSSGSTGNPPCRSEPVRRFAIADGDSRRIPGLQRFRPCVSAEDAMPQPDCEGPEPMAAR